MDNESPRIVSQHMTFDHDDREENNDCEESLSTMDDKFGAFMSTIAALAAVGFFLSWIFS